MKTPSSWAVQRSAQGSGPRCRSELWSSAAIQGRPLVRPSSWSPDAIIGSTQTATGENVHTGVSAYASRRFGRPIEALDGLGLLLRPQYKQSLSRGPVVETFLSRVDATALEAVTHNFPLWWGACD